MDALAATGNQASSLSHSPAYNSTRSPTLDAWNSISPASSGDDITQHLRAAWAEDPQLALRIIWGVRSIPGGKSDKKTFYRAFAWLYEHHPRTAIANLRMLVEPVAVRKKKHGDFRVPHGCWKDLLDIVALAAVDELKPSIKAPAFLEFPRQKRQYNRHSSSSSSSDDDEMDDERKEADRKERIDASLKVDAQRSADAKEKRAEVRKQAHERLTEKLADTPKFRALYIAVARLFANKLTQDLDVHNAICALPAGTGIGDLRWKISLAAKWAPTPGLSHDRVTNLSSAISILLSRSHHSADFPKALQATEDAREQLTLLRSFFGRWVLRPLRAAIGCPEPLMAARQWRKIRYDRVSAVAMQRLTKQFYKRDRVRFEEYLTRVEAGEASISGATVIPGHAVAGAAGQPARERKLENMRQAKTRDKNPETAVKRERAERSLQDTQTRVREAQWRALLASLRGVGSLGSCLAVCHTSTTMGYMSTSGVHAVHSALGLSLLVAALAAPPFDTGLVAFSGHPQFVPVNSARPLAELAGSLDAPDAPEFAYGGQAKQGADLQSVFAKLLLPLARASRVRQKDMIQRLFVFSNMAFEPASGCRDVTEWQTNFDVLRRSYLLAGYDPPEVVFWDLNTERQRMFEAVADRKGVALVEGLSPGLLKVFMGASGAEEFNPVNVMKKALMQDSFDGLVVVD